MKHIQNESVASVVGDGRISEIAQVQDRRNPLIGLMVAGVVLISVAGCGSAQPAQQPTQTAQAQAGAGGPGRNGPRMTPASELPTSQPEVTGLFLRRQDNSIFVGTDQGNFRRGNATPGAQATPDATRRAQALERARTPVPYTGPQTEVVINASTVFYKDVTQMNFQAGQNGQAVQQQVQAVSSLDDLLGQETEGGTVTVWGSKNGDQIVATLVVYRPVQQRPQATPAG